MYYRRREELGGCRSRCLLGLQRKAGAALGCLPPTHTRAVRGNFKGSSSSDGRGTLIGFSPRPKQMHPPNRWSEHPAGFALDTAKFTPFLLDGFYNLTIGKTLQDRYENDVNKGVGISHP